MMKSRTRQHGSAMVYILIAIALLAALTATFMDSSSQQTSSQNSANLVTDLKSQINSIRSAIDECILVYPGGDDALAGNAAVGGDSPLRPYPLNPYNTYLAVKTPGLSRVADIKCPGNPGTSNNHASIFGGASGKFLPKPPNLFGDWYYYNSIDGVWFYIQTNKTDSFLTDALKKLDGQFSKCETQYINAGASPVQLTSDSNASFVCSANSQCFKVLVKATGTTLYPGETGCP